MTETVTGRKFTDVGVIFDREHRSRGPTNMKVVLHVFFRQKLQKTCKTNLHAISCNYIMLCNDLPKPAKTDDVQLLAKTVDVQ